MAESVASAIENDEYKLPPAVSKRVNALKNLQLKENL